MYKRSGCESWSDIDVIEIFKIAPSPPFFYVGGLGGLTGMCRLLRDRNMQLEARSHAKAMDAEYGQTIGSFALPPPT